MVINANSPTTLSSTVDKAEEVLLAGLDLKDGGLTSRKIGLVVFAVEKPVGGADRAGVGNNIILSRGGNIKTTIVSIQMIRKAYMSYIS